MRRLAHIDQFGPGHTDTIVTRNYQTAMRFVQEVDSSAVMVNASTRLHGGEQFGLGPEIGMNTTHFHARGPLTLETLTTEKFRGAWDWSVTTTSSCAHRPIKMP